MEQSSRQTQEQARARCSVIMQVRSGALSATEAATKLGVSRKTYYEWEARALDALTAAMEDRPTGRPITPVDDEKESLKQRVAQLEKELYLASKTIEVKDLLHALARQEAAGQKSIGRDSEKKRRPKNKP